jgi:hypothetical protein
MPRLLVGDQAVPIFGPNFELLDSPFFAFAASGALTSPMSAAGVPLRRRISQVLTWMSHYSKSQSGFKDF